MAFRVLTYPKVLHPLRLAIKEQAQASPWRARLVWLLLGLTVVVVVAELPLWPPFHDWKTAHYDLPYSGEASMFLAGLDRLSTLLLALLGALIIVAQPQNRIGWLLSGTMPAVALAQLCDIYAVYAYIIYPERALPLRELAFWIQNWASVPLIGLIAVVLPLLFPNGHLPSRQWKWLVAWTIGLTALLSFILAFHPDVAIGNMFMDIENDLSNPYGIAALPKFLDLFVNPLMLLLFLTIFPACFSLGARYRRADATTRQQIKWIAFGLAIMITLYATLGPFYVLGYTPDLTRLVEVVIQAASISIPFLLGVSIFKYRLYDIDIIINRTLVYGALTALVVGLYVLVVGSLGALLQANNDLIVSLLATGAVAVLFQPLRARLQRGVNRLMFGERDDPYRLLARLGRQLNTATRPGDLLPTIAGTVAAALKLPYAAIMIRRGREEVLAAAYGTAPSATQGTALVYQDEQVGRLIVGQRAPGEALTLADERVLQDIARQLGAVVYAARLAGDLQRSRERLVTTREEERRRLRRDLHDGLGPALASQTLKLDAAIDLLESDPQTATRLLSELKTQTQSLVADVRRLVYDLRPPALDELGLLGALRSHIPQLTPQPNGPAITIETPPSLPPLSAAVEVAAYRIAQEALTNVVKHARAGRCSLQLAIVAEGTCLQITVRDDGLGLPQPLTSGIGLQSMRERAEELGGGLVTENLASGGARIVAELPLLREEMSP